MYARSLIACREVVPDVFEAVLPLITGSGSAVRAPAMTTAAYCLDHPALAGRKDALAELLADTAAVSPEPRERAVVARLLGMLGGRPEDLLNDEHPGVRACAALARQFSGDERATRELVSALEVPERTELIPAQRAFLSALVANGHQPFGEALCLLLLGT
jgi:HEAT repeat protein